MKKFFLSLFFLFSTLIILLFVAYLSRSYVVSQIISGKLGAKVHIQSIDYSNETITIKNLRIHNPSHSSLAHAITIKQILIIAPLVEYFKEKMVIQLLEVDDITIAVEFYDKGHKKSNWNHIMTNMDSGQKEDVDGRSAMIRKMVLGPINIIVKSPGTDPKKYAPIPQIKFTNITTKNGELVNRIVETIISRLMINLKGIIQLPIDAAKGSLDFLFKPFESLFKRNDDKDS